MQTNLEKTLKKLVSIPSTADNSKACHEIIEYVRDELEPLGLYIVSDINRPNPWFIATTQPTKEPDILLAAHLDVVPGPSESFTLTKQGDRLYGRGVYDMKFAAACYIEFAKKHADMLHTLNIGFYFSTDEEIGGPTVPLMLEQGWRPRRVFLPDGGEDWHIEEQAKGFFGLQITAHGKTAHGSRPWEGQNALHALIDIAYTLRSEYPPGTHDDLTVSVNILNGGNVFNQLPDTASMYIDVRGFETSVLNAFLHRTQELAKLHDAKVVVGPSGAPVYFDKDSTATHDFLTALQDITGEKPKYIKSYGGSDARFFAERTIPSIIIEPHGGGRHAPNEWILAADLEKYFALLERWIIQ